jgi:hypothetical protein
MNGSTFICSFMYISITQPLYDFYDCAKGLYACFCMFQCSNLYISMIHMVGFYDPEIGFYGLCLRNLS